MTIRTQNLANLALVARGLGDIAEDVAFVGGATIALYVNDLAAPDARATRDIDAVIELSTYADFAHLEERLRARGFSHLTKAGAPICRWRYRDLLVDIMPADPSILGFSNRWYRDAMRHRVAVKAAPGVSVFIFPIPYLIATKLEAFKTRGSDDWLASHDIEDIIAVLDGATNAAAELQATSGDLDRYLCAELSTFLHHPQADDILLAHVPPDATAERRANRIKQLIASVVGRRDSR